MSVLQWALLILGAAAVVAVYVVSRRERGGEAQAARSRPLLRPPSGDQMDIFSAGSSNASAGSGQFDEFGVSKPRKRGGSADAPTAQTPLFTDTPAAAPAETSSAPAPRPPLFAPKPKAPVEELIIALLIAEREGTAIFGTKLHAALKQQGLQYGAKQIYHRMDRGMVQYSVASLIKPGILDPAEAPEFSTPGLSVFMVLPGAIKPLAAFEDMIRTAQALAKALNAEVYDSRKQNLSPDIINELRTAVSRWAQAQGLA